MSIIFNPIPINWRPTKMRMLVYAVSAACGCAPAGYGYYQRSYYQPAAYVDTCADPCGSASTWGGETALPVGYSYGYQPYYSPYYVGNAWNSYGYHRPRVRVGVQVEAKNHHHRPSLTAIAQSSSKTKVAHIPTPKPDPRKRIAHHFPAKMVAIQD